MTVCKSCGGTGLIPWRKRKDVFVHCSCHPQYGDEPVEYLYESVPSDVDFAISNDCYRSLCLLHGWPDPVSDRTPEPKREIKPIFHLRPVDKELDRLKAVVNQLQGKVLELRAKKAEVKKGAGVEVHNRADITDRFYR